MAEAEKAIPSSESDERVNSVSKAGLSDAAKLVDEKKLMRKVDWYLIPWLCLLYLASFLDRTNIGNARLYGLEKDLGMDPSSNQFYTSLTVFFVTYALFEPLTNVLLKMWRPRIFLTATMILWGITMTCMGLVHNYGGLVTTRIFLGVFEAGLFPGVNFYLSAWYKRSEFGIRAAIFFSAAALAGSFGGLLAVAIAQMDGIGGKPGWAWIFILEGLATMLIGIACWFMVHDFPDEARFLKPEEKEVIIYRLAQDKQSSSKHEDFNIKYFLASVKDWKTYAFAIVYMGCDGPLYAFSLFTPTIISGLGYSGTTANLLSVPPYAAAAVLTVFIGWLADKTQQRGLCNIGVSIIGIIGFIMLLSSQSNGVKYAGVYLGALGIYPCISNTIVWASNNVEGVYKRGVTMGIVIGWGNLNGIVSSNIYRTKPQYYSGHGTVLGYLVAFLFFGSIVTRQLLERENKKRLRGERDHWVEGLTEEQIAQKASGDEKPDFLYTL